MEMKRLARKNMQTQELGKFKIFRANKTGGFHPWNTIDGKKDCIHPSQRRFDLEQCPLSPLLSPQRANILQDFRHWQEYQ